MNTVRTTFAAICYIVLRSSVTATFRSKLSESFFCLKSLRKRYWLPARHDCSSECFMNRGNVSASLNGFDYPVPQCTAAILTPPLWNPISIFVLVLLYKKHTNEKLNIITTI